MLRIRRDPRVPSTEARQQIHLSCQHGLTRQPNSSNRSKVIHSFVHRVGLFGLVAGAVTACSGGEGSGTDTPSTTDLGTQAEVALHKMPFVDESRPTKAYTDLPASDVRTLETWVWLPAGPVAETRDREVVMLAHGNGGHPDRFLFLAESLADHGAVVVAPVFPATNAYGDSAGLAVGDLYEQPADLDYVRQALREAAADPDSVLYRRLDVDRMVACGHSLGGATVAGWTRWGDDPRTDLLATVLVAPAVFLNGNFGDGPHPEGPPAQIVQGSDDPLVAASVSEGLYADIDGPAALALLPGVGHAEVMDGDGEAVHVTYELIRAVYDQVTDRDGSAWGAELDAVEGAGVLVERKGL
jgi:pimeloyl-ACP methyl ester carboxylesterase